MRNEALGAGGGVSRGMGGGTGEGGGGESLAEARTVYFIETFIFLSTQQFMVFVDDF